MLSRRTSWLIAAGALALTAFGQTIQVRPRVAPVPPDPMEIAAGPIQEARTPESRQTALQLLAHARSNYALRKSGQAYDLKVSFAVNSGGQTNFDGAWQMEELFDPRHGVHWTATAAAGYTTTQISANGIFYADGTPGVIPLRLQEARAALLDPLPANVERYSIRTSTATTNGAAMTCLLISDRGFDAGPGRSWQETEDCFDPQTGLLQIHSQVPGRYYAYSYSDAPRLGAILLPKTVTVTEAGKIVSTISVDSLTELGPIDPNLFVPTAQMKANGPAIAMGGAQKITGLFGRQPFKAGAKAFPVCVFGLVTPEGRMVEAHSLQPEDPNSQEAVATAKKMKFSKPASFGARPQQYFAFVIVKFVSK